jgi:hypothetical protein
MKTNMTNPQIHRRKQHIQKPPKRTPKEPKDAPRNGIPRTHDVLGYDITPSATLRGSLIS